MRNTPYGKTFAEAVDGLRDDTNIIPPPPLPLDEAAEEESISQTRASVPSNRIDEINRNIGAVAAAVAAIDGCWGVSIHCDITPAQTTTHNRKREGCQVKAQKKGCNSPHNTYSSINRCVNRLILSKHSSCALRAQLSLVSNVLRSLRSSARLTL